MQLDRIKDISIWGGNLKGFRKMKISVQVILQTLRLHPFLQARSMDASPAAIRWTSANARRAQLWRISVSSYKSNGGHSDGVRHHAREKAWVTVAVVRVAQRRTLRYRDWHRCVTSNCAERIAQAFYQAASLLLRNRIGVFDSGVLCVFSRSSAHCEHTTLSV